MNHLGFICPYVQSPNLLSPPPLCPSISNAWPIPRRVLGKALISPCFITCGDRRGDAAERCAGHIFDVNTNYPQPTSQANLRPVDDSKARIARGSVGSEYRYNNDIGKCGDHVWGRNAVAGAQKTGPTKKILAVSLLRCTGSAREIRNNPQGTLGKEFVLAHWRRFSPGTELPLYLAVRDQSSTVRVFCVVDTSGWKKRGERA